MATDVNGRYSIDAPENGQLRISFIGYEIQDLDINSKSVINVVLVPSQKTLDEVVITAFGTQKKENVTGSIATISGKDLVTTPVGNITNMLAGSATGISGLQTSGEPGVNSAQIYIRGIATYGNTQPLFVIDGVEQPAARSWADGGWFSPDQRPQPLRPGIGHAGGLAASQPDRPDGRRRRLARRYRPGTAA